MIDWVYVATSSLWILGLAVILAAFSYHDWLAKETGRRRREIFSTRSWRLAFYPGMLLVALGFGLGRDVAWWERALWGILTADFVWQTVRAVREP